MSVTPRCVVESAYALAADTLIYTVPANNRFSIDKCTSYSTPGGTLTLYVVESGGTVGAPKIIALNTLAALGAYTWPEMVGQILEPGDMIYEKAATITTVSRRISGRLIT